jgi:hypothetical protein
MPHLCGKATLINEVRRNNAAGGKSGRMQERQRPIAEWLKDTMARHSISARQWAEKAQLGKDTVSRAIREDYEYVTSYTTVAKLADILGERPPGAAAGVPSVASFASILVVLHQALSPETPLDRPKAEILAAALRDTLLHLADEPEALDDPRLSQVIARVSARPHASPSGRSQKS